MTYINPMAGAVAGGTQAQSLQSADKTRQLRRSQNLKRDSSLRGDQFEHTVESPEAVADIHDDEQKKNQAKKRQKHRADSDTATDDDAGGLDLTA